jgi:hypothetical protein
MVETQEVEKVIFDLKRIEREIDEIAINALRKNEAKIVELILSQLKSGTQGDGKEITPRYTVRTVQIKKAKAQEFRFVTLRDTGDFYKSITVEYDKTEARIIATDSKTKKLIAKYGPEILELSPANLQRLKDHMRPGIERAFLNLL